MNSHADPHARAQLIHSRPALMQLPIDELPRVVREEDTLDLKRYVNLLAQQRWLIAGVTLMLALAAAVYAFSVPPVYEANMLIHVEETSPNASKNILNEVSSLFETKKAAIAEMELLHSRMVVAAAVDKLRLYIEARPRYFPLLGRWLAAQSAEPLSEPGIFGYGGYVWAGETLEVAQFDVPAGLQNREFVVTALGEQRFRISEAESGLAFNGMVGSTLQAAAALGNIELRVARLTGRRGAQFLLRRRSRLSAIEQTQRAMLIAEQGKQSGVIAVTLQGPSAALVNAILSEVGREYMRQNLARQTEEAEKSLAFLNQQLPELKQQLERAEGKYNEFRHQHGTVDLAEEAKISLQQAAAAKTRRVELLQKKTELLTRFTSEHPVLVGINTQLRELDTEINQGAERIRAMPLLEQEQVRMTRDIKINTDLYTALSNTAQQLRILSVGKVSNVRLVDAPMAPEMPIRPNRTLIIGAGAGAGLVLGLLLAFARKALHDAIDDPQRIERMLGTRVVYASIPHSSKQDELDKLARVAGGPMGVLAQEFPEDPAIEILRSFRSALTFSMPHFRNNIVMFAGPTPGLGKSFVSVNFAAVMAASGKRVLLIDADLRNGHLHQYFDTRREHGLADAIAGTLRPDEIIQRHVIDNLDFIPTGAFPPKRAEFLMQGNFGAVLERVSADYDLVLIDAPPVLAVADALIIGAHAGAVFILVRAGATTEEEITESITRLSQSGIAPQGILFNDIKLRLGRYGYPYQYGQAQRIELAS